jgi:hypothetical protein
MEAEARRLNASETCPVELISFWPALAEAKTKSG